MRHLYNEVPMILKKYSQSKITVQTENVVPISLACFWNSVFIVWNGLMCLTAVWCVRASVHLPVEAHGEGSSMPVEGTGRPRDIWAVMLFLFFLLFFLMWYHLLWLTVQTPHSTKCFLFLYIIWYFIVFSGFIKGISDIMAHIHLLAFSQHKYAVGTHLC